MSEYTEITVRTNSFAITKLPSMEYHQYDIFIPTVKVPQKRLRLFHHFQTSVAPALFKNRAVYDGNAIAYCPCELTLADGGTGIYDIYPGSSSRESQKIKLTETIGETIVPKIDVEDLTKRGRLTDKAIVATSLIQYIMRQRPNMDCKNERAYFPGQERYTIGSGYLEIWRGIFQSVRPTIGRMILTIDTCVAVVYAAGPLDNLCGRYAGVKNIRELRLEKDDPLFRGLETFLKGILIKYKMANNSMSKHKCIYGLEPFAGEFPFTNGNGEKATVKDHFKEAHGIHITHPGIIGVRISSDKAPRPIVLPLEVCTVLPGQFYRRKLDDSLMPEMLKFATLKPEDRLRKIVDGAKRYKDSEFVVESHMSVNVVPLEARGKILKAPLITYGENLEMTPSLGSWNLQNKKFVRPEPLNSWAVVNFCPLHLSKAQFYDHLSDLMKCCDRLGMSSKNPDAMEIGNLGDVEKSLDGAMRSAVKASNSRPPRILIIILPKLVPAVRIAIKHWGDITHGVLTQCICLDKFHSSVKRSNNLQYWSNVALKINARLRGQNSNANGSPIMKELALNRFMIMGADVSHPGPGMQKPSVTGLVYSLDPCAAQYAALTNLQHPRVEIIQNLYANVTLALKHFQEMHTRFPVRLFFYRDGVSEGELDAVARVEITAIKEAIKELGQENNIKLTFIVVTKRHHTVFFPTSNRFADNKGNNLPGTVISEHITHPAMHDFYLQSHASLQGTARSSHYIILLDENISFDMDRLQSLSYALCNVYAKATRSVSIPAPIYYADLVCARGMIHIDRNANLTLEDVSPTLTKNEKKAQFDLQPWLEAFKSVNPGMRNKMYFL